MYVRIGLATHFLLHGRVRVFVRVFPVSAEIKFRQALLSASTAVPRSSTLTTSRFRGGLLLRLVSTRLFGCRVDKALLQEMLGRREQAGSILYEFSVADRPTPGLSAFSVSWCCIVDDRLSLPT